MDAWTAFAVGAFAGAFATWLRMRGPSSRIPFVQVPSAKVVRLEVARKRRSPDSAA